MENLMNILGNGEYILILEKNNDMKNYYKLIIEEELKYRCIIVKNREDFLENLAEHNPKIIIINIWDSDEEVMELYKNIENIFKKGIIFTSSLNRKKFVKNMGVNNYFFKKPFELGSFSLAIKKLSE